ncbi:UpxY family transcription antiterminator [Gramella sp. AN32]|uniref:UpxY family transcription antiterminator n=1 Tax=Christiangramia antarctica TaxID=2058158 RepID=A0ABW5XAF2_9FLAO|nr:UpxY family transcription antiterminator [Gramella sp. AN32]MCM4155374.1 antitermination protein NusG [Gramella sp. AN32]
MVWYVIRTKPKHEIKTSELLKDFGMEVYCPVITEVRQWSDRKKKVSVPLFNSYIFVRSTEKNRKEVFNAPGVIGFLNWLGKPAIAREEEINEIMSWLNNDYLSNYKIQEIKEGDRVTFSKGNIKSEEAIVQEVGKRKVKLFLPEIGWLLTADISEIR